MFAYHIVTTDSHRTAQYSHIAFQFTKSLLPSVVKRKPHLAQDFFTKSRRI